MIASNFLNNAGNASEANVPSAKNNTGSNTPSDLFSQILGSAIKQNKGEDKAQNSPKHTPLPPLKNKIDFSAKKRENEILEKEVKPTHNSAIDTQPKESNKFLKNLATKSYLANEAGGKSSQKENNTDILQQNNQPLQKMVNAKHTQTQQVIAQTPIKLVTPIKEEKQDNIKEFSSKESKKGISDQEKSIIQKIQNAPSLKELEAVVRQVEGKFHNNNLQETIKQKLNNIQSSPTQSVQEKLEASKELLVSILRNSLQATEADAKAIAKEILVQNLLGNSTKKPNIKPLDIKDFGFLKEQALQNEAKLAQFLQNTSRENQVLQKIFSQSKISTSLLEFLNKSSGNSLTLNDVQKLADFAELNLKNLNFSYTNPSNSLNRPLVIPSLGYNDFKDFINSLVHNSKPGVGYPNLGENGNNSGGGNNIGSILGDILAGMWRPNKPGNGGNNSGSGNSSNGSNGNGGNGGNSGNNSNGNVGNGNVGGGIRPPSKPDTPNNGYISNIYHPLTPKLAVLNKHISDIVGQKQTFFDDSEGKMTLQEVLLKQNQMAQGKKVETKNDIVDEIRKINAKGFAQDLLTSRMEGESTSKKQTSSEVAHSKNSNKEESSSAPSYKAPSSASSANSAQDPHVIRQQATKEMENREINLKAQMGEFDKQMLNRANGEKIALQNSTLPTSLNAKKMKENGLLEAMSTKIKSESKNSSNFSPDQAVVMNDAMKADFMYKSAAAKETLRNFTSGLREGINNYKPPLSKLSLELSPENLGNVEVTIKQRGNSVVVQILSNPQALQLFMANANDFKQQLFGVGFENVEMSFQDSQGNEFGSQGDGGGSQHGGYNGEQRGGEEESENESNLTDEMVYRQEMQKMYEEDKQTSKIWNTFGLETYKSSMSIEKKLYMLELTLTPRYA